MEIGLLITNSQGRSCFGLQHTCMDI